MRAHWLAAFLVIATTAACTNPGGGTVYSRRDMYRPWAVQEATVVQVSEVAIEGRETAIGTIGGGLIGHAVGRSVGQGSGSRIAGAVGAVAGAVAGQKAEKAATQRKAWEILVDFGRDGETLAIVQPADQTFGVGERVRVYTRSDGSARVAKL